MPRLAQASSATAPMLWGGAVPLDSGSHFRFEHPVPLIDLVPRRVEEQVSHHLESHDICSSRGGTQGSDPGLGGSLTPGPRNPV
jgi:hypothetical protein